MCLFLRSFSTKKMCIDGGRRGLFWGLLANNKIIWGSCFSVLPRLSNGKGDNSGVSKWNGGKHILWSFSLMVGGPCRVWFRPQNYINIEAFVMAQVRDVS